MFYRLCMGLSALILLAACNQGGGDTTAEGAPKKKERRFLSVGAAPPGGAFFAVGSALAKVAEDNKGDLNWQVNSESTKGTQENIRRLVDGGLDFALANAAISYFALRGEGAWQKPHEISAVMTLAPNVATFITTKSSGVNSFADLAGKRVTVGPDGAGFHYFVRPIVEAHGVNWDDLTVLHNTQTGSVDMLKDSSASAVFLGGAVPTSSISQASASMDIAMVPFDPAVRQKLIDDYPFFFPATIPAGTYRGIDEPYEGLNVGSMHLITSPKIDEDTVYEFTKRIYEFRDQVVEQHPAGKAINPKNVIRDTGIPFHPGAVRYYKEIGIWPASTE
ncbi:MAG: TAXI family TRAP transporter solute-binding subunit [Acidobacteriota bacterium]|nr:TAXI family TRAP transporter solute-binding subunit [Acidobacteriota bacterium]